MNLHIDTDIKTYYDIGDFVIFKSNALDFGIIYRIGVIKEISFDSSLKEVIYKITAVRRSGVIDTFLVKESLICESINVDSIKKLLEV